MKPVISAFYKHTDGGYYFVSELGRDSKDGTAVVIYKHVWPFEEETWTRPLDQWASRFSLISREQLEAIMRVNSREEAQAIITTAKTHRKNLK